jgi:hypothetical protein
MLAAAILMKEIETMPEEIAVEVLDFAMFLKGKHTSAQPQSKITIENAYGIFKDLKGIDTSIERDEEDRI